MHTDYKSPAIRWYRDAQQQASRTDMLTHIETAERLIASIDAEATYPAAEVLSQIDGRPLPEAGNRKISGTDLLNDLRLLVEDMSDMVELAAEAVGEQVFTVEELAKQFNVSTKTISRWRALGLVSRRLVFDGRKRVGFLRSSVDRFVKNNAERVERGSRFSQLSDNQREEFIQRAREMAQAGQGQGEISRLLAERTGRSVETIRAALRTFDTENPDDAIFPAGSGPLTDVQKKNIFRAYRRGVSVDKLCRDYNRTKTTVYRVINDMRAEHIKELPLDYIDNPRFSRKGADNACLGPMPEAETATRKARRPSGLPPYLASLYEMQLLTREQEQHLFRKYNYLKYKANKLRDTLDYEHPKSTLMDEIESLHEQIVDLKNQIARCNLRLVVSIAKRHVKPDQNFFELVSDGNLSLLRAVEKFDFARGNKFSTYASWAIMKNFARTIPGEYRQRDRFRTSYDELFDATQEKRANPMVEETLQQDRVSKIQRVLGRLDERERQIIVGRFGLDHSKEPQTLKQVGEELGVTKERIRQIEARALNKLRLAAQEEKIALEI
ncbi:sigma-70 family RNA polymerase sigma factor [Bythopirellula goksoeyrii]|uniref:RNA polymerase principal sigma factor HrdA n=1 Tax=Bythopirellula goksoeyrii TaxID=1400387 RepID=A0A5B9Q2I1_9BACT|nr:sigma-70 family RNA polymerase sigma factor [Bythopirellula goksoeyrii]QEG33218.1 RNA polymerase principal sigma factor HrdA [Bythopirellula goksoeyrii]